MMPSPRAIAEIGSVAGRSMVVWMIGLLFLGWANPADTAGASPDTSLAYDTTHVSLRTPPDDLVERYRNDPAFSYETDAPSESRPFFLWRWLDDWFDGMSAAENNALNNAIDTGFLLIVIGLTLWLILQVFRMEGSTPWKRAASSWPDDESIGAEAEPPDYLDRAEHAYTAGDRRAAIRWYYRGMLHMLMRADLITYMPEKTNRAYVNDVQAQADASIAEDVAHVSQVFEYAWYGRFEVAGAEVDAVRAAVERVQDRISASPPVSA